MIRVFLTSHAHIDTEWLWPLEEAVDAARITFENVVNLVKSYPELTYVQSVSFYYEEIEKRYPELFEEIKRLVESGNWKPVGGTFLEFDAQMPSGESLARHFLYGLRYFRKLKLPKTLWLADSFGFPPSLPMLIRKAGMKYFATHKLKWNDTNRFPYYLFRWRSPDGSEVLSYHLPGNYNDYLYDIFKVKRLVWLMWKTHGITDVLVMFGRGDHGGGPEAEELENIRKWSKQYAKEFKFEFSGLDEYMEYVEQKHAGRLPLIDSDELYLEFHRGIFTTGAPVKWLVRRGEEHLIAAEKLWSALYLMGKSYPKEAFDSLWRLLMLNHGHDTMCTTVTPDVYKEAIRRGIEVIRTSRKLILEGLRILAKRVKEGGTLVFNPLSWKADIYLRGKDVPSGQELSDGGRIMYVAGVPPHGYKVAKESDKPSAEATVREEKKRIVLENEHIRVVVSKKTGWITSILHKKTGREALKGPVRIKIYSDYRCPARSRSIFAVPFDAWEVWNRCWPNGAIFRHKVLKKPKCVEVRERGPLYASVVVEYEYKQRLAWRSKFVVEIGVYATKPYVELSFYVVWHTWHKFAKLQVPVNVDTIHATFEVPYGIVRRRDALRSKDRRDRAKYEVSGQRWADVSDGEFGVAVIDDSKYGYSWINGILEVSLLRSPTFPMRKLLSPNPKADKAGQRLGLDWRTEYLSWVGWLLVDAITMLATFAGEILIPLLKRDKELMRKYRPMDWGTHRFRIAIHPHEGDWREGGVPEVAAEFNQTFYHVEAEGGGELPGEGSLLPATEPPVHVTAVKKSEDGDALVLRLFNYSGKPEEVDISWAGEASKVDIPEFSEEPVGGSSIKLNPLELESLKVPKGGVRIRPGG